MIILFCFVDHKSKQQFNFVYLDFCFDDASLAKKINIQNIFEILHRDYEC